MCLAFKNICVHIQLVTATSIFSHIFHTFGENGLFLRCFFLGFVRTRAVAREYRQQLSRHFMLGFFILWTRLWRDSSSDVHGTSMIDFRIFFFMLGYYSRKLRCLEKAVTNLYERSG